MLQCLKCGDQPQGVCPGCGKTSVAGLERVSPQALRALGADGLRALNAALAGGPEPAATEPPASSAPVVEPSLFTEPPVGLREPAPEEVEKAALLFMRHPEAFADADERWSTADSEALWERFKPVLNEAQPRLETVLEVTEMLVGHLPSVIVPSQQQLNSLAFQGSQIAHQVIQATGTDAGALLVACNVLRQVRHLWAEKVRRSREP